MSLILQTFSQIINGFKSIPVNIGITTLSLFDLLIGVFIISAISKLVLRWLFDNRSYGTNLLKSFKNNLDTTVSKTDIWTFDTDSRGNYSFTKKESFLE